MSLVMKRMVVALIVISVGVGLGFIIWGIIMQSLAASNEGLFNDEIANYFIKSKEVRDSAATGSQLNEDLVQIQQRPSMLLYLKLVGIGRLLVGIFASLIGILIALLVMPAKMGEKIGEMQKQMMKQMQEMKMGKMPGKQEGGASEHGQGKT